MENAKDILRDQWNNLPTDVKEAIVSAKMSDNLAKIAEEHKLHLDQAEKMEEATMFLLLGLMNTQEYLSALTVGTHVTPNEATEIAKTVDRYILSPIRGSLREIQQKLDEADRAESANQPVQAEPLKTAAGNVITTPVEPEVQMPAPAAHSSGPIPHLRTMPKDIARAKMEESIRMPKEEIGKRYAGDAKGNTASKYTTDPYREQA